MEKLVNEHGAAAIIGCSIALMRKWRRFGDGPRYCKLGRLVRYKQADSDNFLADHLVEPTAGR